MTELKWKFEKPGLKRILAMFLAVCICVTMTQMDVFAAGEAASQNETTPGEGEATPGEGETTPGEGEATPGEGETTPGEEEATPGEGDEEQTVKVTGITLSQTSLSLKTGDTATLTATVLPEDATDKAVTWSTSNASVATVENGTVTAKAAGTATITAKAGEFTASCTVTVTNPAPATIEATGVTLSASSLSLEIGKTATLTATVAPANATNKTVAWTSSNASIATVSNGTVTAKAAGTATITVSTANGKTAVCKVTVVKPAPTGVTLNKKSATVVKGKTLQLKATVAPANASSTSVTWKSSKTSVATVSNSGKVTAKAAGTATITATTVNGKKATCKVTVAAVTLNAKSIPLQVGKSTTAVKVATKSPSNDKVKSYKSSNTKIATVNSKGKVTAKKVGKATITVTMKSGATAKYTVNVQKGKVVTKSLKLDAKSKTLLKGKKATLKVTRNPISATEKITWSSSNKKVVTVDKNGKITAKKAGTATITAKASNGKKATCKVTVPGVTLKATKATIKVGKTTTIKVKSTVVKKDKVKSYKVANSKIAKVDSKGKVTGLKKGKTSVTVTMKSGATAKFTVTVK